MRKQNLHFGPRMVEGYQEYVEITITLPYRDLTMFQLYKVDSTSLAFFFFISQVISIFAFSDSVPYKVQTLCQLFLLCVYFILQITCLACALPVTFPCVKALNYAGL